MTMQAGRKLPLRIRLYVTNRGESRDEVTLALAPSPPAGTTPAESDPGVSEFRMVQLAVHRGLIQPGQYPIDTQFLLSEVIPSKDAEHERLLDIHSKTDELFAEFLLQHPPGTASQLKVLDMLEWNYQRILNYQPPPDSPPDPPPPSDH